MRVAYRRYYRTLFSGWFLILGTIYTVLFFVRSFNLREAGVAIFQVVTFGIQLGTSVPGILLCVVASSCLMLYGLAVRKRYTLTLFWSGFILFFLSGMMGLGTLDSVAVGAVRAYPA
jgi:hypothetical protein